jgi:hypothetical protein
VTARLERLCGGLAILLLLGCAAGSERPGPRASEASFQPSGFLGDYSAFRRGAGSQARLVYLDPAADFSGYERVIIEPAVVWQSGEARFAGVPPAQREALAREFEAELERAFAEEFLVGEAAGPGTLRVRHALTAAIAASESSDPGRLQYVEVEIELLDAVANRRLAAAVDSKGSTPSDARGAPQAVEAGAVFRDWSERIAVRVAAMRSFDRQQR